MDGEKSQPGKHLSWQRNSACKRPEGTLACMLSEDGSKVSMSGTGKEEAVWRLQGEPLPPAELGLSGGPGAAGQGNEGAPGADSQKRVPADQPTQSRP